MTKVKLIKGLYPYEQGEIADMREDVAEMRVREGFVEIINDNVEKAPNKSMEGKAKKTK